jgi:hypothetical protein
VRKYVTIICLIIILTSFCGCFGGGFRDYGRYERDIVRNTSNDIDKKVINISENLNYSEIFGIDRFDEAGDIQWANYIDTEVLDYYNSRYDSLKSEDAKHDVELFYEADVYEIQKLEIRYNYNEKSDEYSMKVYNSEQRMYEFTNVVFPEVAISSNGSSYSFPDMETDWELNYILVYLCRLDLDFWDQWGVKAGTGIYVNQILVMDTNFEPLFILIDTGGWKI